MSDTTVAATGQPTLPDKGMYFTSWKSEDWMETTFDETASEERPYTGTMRSVIYDYGTDDHPVRCYIVQFAPGTVLRAHKHDTDYCSVVLEGELEVTRKTFTAGDIRFVKADTTYGPLIAGPEGATIIEFFGGPLQESFSHLARRVFTPPWTRHGGTDSTDHP